MPRQHVTGRTTVSRSHVSRSHVDRSGSGTAAPPGPVISNVSAAPTATSAVISWDLDMYGTGYVEWGTDTSYGHETTRETSYNYQSHAQTISGLTTGQTYHFRVRSSGPQFSPVESVSADYTFTTTSVGPVISNMQATAVTTTSATLSWTTDVAATAVANYGTSTAYGTNTTTDSTYTQTSHSFDITGLTANTLYHWRPRSSAPSTNPVFTNGGDQTFTTLSGNTGTYDAIFTGDPTGVTDVSGALMAFIAANNGKRIALGVNAIYKCTRVIVNAHTNTIIDFRGAQLRNSVTGNWLFGLLSCNGVTINDFNGVGTGYISTGPFDPYQWEHALVVADGANNVINSPVTRDTRGDGICCDIEIGGYGPVPPVAATNTQINSPNLQNSGRNNVSIISGSATITGGLLWHAGLCNFDIEPNNASQAPSCSGTIDGTDLRGTGEWGNGVKGTVLANVFSGGPVVISAGGDESVRKTAVIARHLTGDRLDMYIHASATAEVTNSTSDVQAIARFQNIGATTFSGNTRITQA